MSVKWGVEWRCAAEGDGCGRWPEWRSGGGQTWFVKYLRALVGFFCTTHIGQRGLRHSGGGETVVVGVWRWRYCDGGGAVVGMVAV
ncbi:hypothetical protein HanIR_Chr09g0394431 [Helianthus annuus]|nr:hypothetical protein HanIR_Chr09g0394431 [Helianthus annuus]